MLTWRANSQNSEVIILVNIIESTKKIQIKEAPSTTLLIGPWIGTDTNVCWLDVIT